MEWGSQLAQLVVNRRPPKPAAHLRKQPIQVSPRDIQVFAALQKYRVLDRPMIGDLLYGGESNARFTKGRLKALYEHGYIERVERPGRWNRPRPSPGYRLAKRGADRLAESKGVSAEMIHYWGRGDDIDWHPTRVSENFIEHMLSLSLLRLQFEQAAAKAGAVIEQWLDHVDLLPSWKTERVTIKLEPSGKAEVWPVTPDAAFTLSNDKGQAYFFIESDRRTETIHKTWQRKIKTYAAYLTSGKFHQTYGVDNQARFRVLTITPSVKRAVSIITAAKKYVPEAAEIFLAAPVSQLNDQLLLAPIWARGGHTAPQMLL